MFYSTILAIFLYLKSFISKLHEIYIVASQKFEEFGNECPHYTPSKTLCYYYFIFELKVNLFKKYNNSCTNIEMLLGAILLLFGAILTLQRTSIDDCQKIYMLL